MEFSALLLPLLAAAVRGDSLRSPAGPDPVPDIAAAEQGRELWSDWGHHHHHHKPPGPSCVWSHSNTCPHGGKGHCDRDQWLCESWECKGMWYPKGCGHKPPHHKPPVWDKPEFPCDFDDLSDLVEDVAEADAIKKCQVWSAEEEDCLNRGGNVVQWYSFGGVNDAPNPYYDRLCCPASKFHVGKLKTEDECREAGCVFPGNGTPNCVTGNGLEAYQGWSVLVESGQGQCDGEVYCCDDDSFEPEECSSAEGLIITGVVDGPLSGGEPKAIELYALTDISNLEDYTLHRYSNGADTSSSSFTFPNQVVPIPAGTFIYVAYEGGNDAPGFLNFFGFSPTFTSSVASFNGDDVVELFRSGSAYDAFGERGVDGTGEDWEYLDGWAYRNNGEGPAPYDTFDTDEWEFSGINALDGETTNGSADTPFPIGTYLPCVIL